MVWRKQIPAGSTGTASEFGGDDQNVVDKFLSGTDVTADITGPTNINTPVEWESGKLSIGNGTNANKITITSSAQSSNYNINIPILSASSDLATSSNVALLATANTLTEINTISKDDVTPLKLYRPINTANSLVGTAYYFKNSSNTQILFSKTQAKLITNTAGSEVGEYELSVIKAGSMTKVWKIDSSGQITTGSGQNILVGGILVNSGVITTTATSSAEFDMLNYSVPANLLGTNGSLRIIISGYCLQNQASATDFTIRIKFGTTTLYDGKFLSAIAQDSVNRPFFLTVYLGNSNATNVQNGSGVIEAQDTGTGGLTTGEGSISDDETQSHGNFRLAAGAKDTTSAQTLQVTMQHSVSNANVSTTVQRKMIEFLPGT